MTFEEILDQAIAMLQRRGRVTYRTLKLQFNLDDEHLEALKDELLYSQSQIVDDAGRGFVWTGTLTPEAAALAAPGLVAAPVATPGERREPRAEEERQQREAAEAAPRHATAEQPRQEQTEGRAEEERQKREAAEAVQGHATLSCDICREQVLSSQFRLHMEAHKAEQPQEAARHPSQGRVSQWVLCALCNERVARREMAAHREAHTGGRSAREIGVVPSGVTAAEPMRGAEEAKAAPRHATLLSCNICREQVLSSQFRLHMEAHKAEQPQEAARHPSQRDTPKLQGKANKQCLACKTQVADTVRVCPTCHKNSFVSTSSSLGEETQRQQGRASKEKAGAKVKINGDKLVFGVVLCGLSLFEFSTQYFTKGFLVPYQQTELLRNLFASGVFPIVIGLWGLKLIFDAFKRFLP